tara:strand:- start:2639 stop:5710 length:3072 start_codon:yes stop_codon:yes gene_type:complete
MPPRPFPQPLLAALLLVLGLTLCGCGGEDTRAASSGAIPAPDPALRPKAPARVLPDTSPKVTPPIEALLGRMSPDSKGDDWPTEWFAELTETLFVAALGDALNGNPTTLLERCSDNARASLVGGERTMLRRDAHVTAYRSGAATSLPVPIAEGIEQWRMALELSGPVRAEGWVSASERDSEAGTFRCRLELEVVHFATREQHALSLDVLWSVQGGLKLTALIGRGGQSVRVTGIGYRDVSDLVLDTTDLGRSTTGAVELVDRFDRSVPFSEAFLGMHGVGVGDLNDDGLEDLYVARRAGEANALLLRTRSGSWVDAPIGHGADLLDGTSGVLVVDLDGDGARDLALGVADELVVLWNDGHARFPHHTRLQAGGGANVNSILAHDFDGDGDLDLVDTRYFRGDRNASPPTPYHDAQNGAANVAWANRGERTFEDVTTELGFDQGNDRFSLAGIWDDFAGDAALDLYVTNDFGRNTLYVAEEGRFREAAAEHGMEDQAAGMGATVSDVNGDGHLDLYVSNLHAASGSRITAQSRFLAGAPLEARASFPRHARGNTLLLGRGDGRFRDATDDAGVAHAGWCWGAIFTDVDGDGRADAFAPNGFLSGPDTAEVEGFFWRVAVPSSPLHPPASGDYLQAWQACSHATEHGGRSWSGHQRNRLFLNTGNARFVDASAVLGVDHLDDGRSAVRLDLDGDGRQDLITRNRTLPLVRVLHNEGTGAAAWITLEVSQPGPNTEAVGAQVVVRSEQTSQAFRVRAGEGYLASPSKRIQGHLAPTVTSVHVDVTWPDGGTSTFGPLATDRAWHLPRDGEPSRMDGFAALPGPPTATEPCLPVPVHRVPAIDPIDVRPLRLPSFEGRDLKVGDLRGKPTVLLLWGSWHDDACDLLAAFADQVEAQDMHVIPLSLDLAPGQEWARAYAEHRGFVGQGGRLDQRGRMLLAWWIASWIGGQRDLQLPAAILIDSEGLARCLYLGEVDPEQVAADAATCARGESLLTGRWIRGQPRRDTSAVVDALRRNGEIELADAWER